MKWMDSEKILTCSSGMKIELFSIQQVINLPKIEPAPSTAKEQFRSKSRHDLIIPSAAAQLHQLIQVKKNLTVHVNDEEEFEVIGPQTCTDYSPPRFPRNLEGERVRSRVQTISQVLIATPTERTSSHALKESDSDDARPLLKAAVSRHSKCSIQIVPEEPDDNSNYK